MERRVTSWHSPALGMEMPLVAYGHTGYPLFMFPTAAADYLEYERFHLIDGLHKAGLGVGGAEHVMAPHPGAEGP